MSLFFSSPWFLTGLLTVLIPVLLLLIKAKTRERVVFSSVIFFKAITLSSNRRLILFALRVLALALLAFAFARPFRLGYENRAAEPVKQLTFVLDRSASMKMSENGRTSWDRAKEAIRAEVKRYGNAVYSLVVFDRKMSAAVLHEKSQRRFLDQLENLQPGDSASDFDMLHRNLRSVCGDQAERGRCVVLSDFLTDQGTLEALVQGGKEPSQASAPMQWVSVRPQSVRNFFIRKLLLPPRPFMAGSEERVGFTYGSLGLTHKSKIVTLWVNEKKAGQVVLDLSKNANGEASMNVAFTDQGWVRLRIQADGDDFSQDDEWAETVWVGKPVEILLVTDHEPEHPFESPDFYLTQALLSVDAEEESRSWVRFYHKSVAELQSEQLKVYDFVVLSEIPQIPAALADQVEGYVRGGGTAVYFAAPQSYLGKRQAMSPREEQLLQGRLQDLEKVPRAAPLSLGPVDYDAPLFKAFESGQRGRLEQIHVQRFRPFLPDENAGQKILLRLGGRWPALAERTLGKGRFFIWTLGWTPYWSDLPKDPLFVPLVLEFIKYAGRQEGVVTRYAEAGQPLVIDEARTEGLDRLELSFPGDKKMTFYPDSSGLFTIDDTDQAGKYEWSHAMRLHQYVLTVPAAESEPLNPGELPEPESVRKTLAANGSGKHSGPFLSPVFFYTACFWGVLLCLWMESFVSVSLYKAEWV